MLSCYNFLDGIGKEKYKDQQNIRKTLKHWEYKEIKNMKRPMDWQNPMEILGGGSILDYTMDDSENEVNILHKKPRTNDYIDCIFGPGNTKKAVMTNHFADNTVVETTLKNI